MDEFSKPFAQSLDRDGSGAAIESEVDAISEAELLEFLSADALGAPADPDFKHKLQDRLWQIVQTRFPKKRRRKWLHGWRRRDIPAAGETDGVAKR